MSLKFSNLTKINDMKNTWFIPADRNTTLYHFTKSGTRSLCGKHDTIGAYGVPGQALVKYCCCKACLKKGGDATLS